MTHQRSATATGFAVLAYLGACLLFLWVLRDTADDSSEALANTSLWAISDFAWTALKTPEFLIRLIGPLFYLSALHAAISSLFRMGSGHDPLLAVRRGLNGISQGLFTGALGYCLIIPTGLVWAKAGFHGYTGIKFDLEAIHLIFGLMGMILKGIEDYLSAFVISPLTEIATDTIA